MYLGLLAGALAFCWQNLLDYIEGTTGYTSNQEPLTQNDLPSLTFCWRVLSKSNDYTEHFFDEKGLTYDKDFTIDMRVKTYTDQSIITLKEDTFVPTQLGFEAE